MRYQGLLGRTLRDAPAGADTASAALLARAGYVRQLGAGIFSLLPLGWATVRRIEEIIREEMERINCWEVAMPVAQPADLWQETGRWAAIGSELVRFEDRGGRDMVLAMTHEEVASDLVRRELRSWRQLPIQFFQIQTKFRDEPRPRAGLLRGREFIMKDAYSFHASLDDLDRFYEECRLAYLRAFHRCGIDVIVAEAGAGIIGGHGSHEFTLLTPAGEDVLLVCPTGDYAANREVATCANDAGTTEAVEQLPLEEVATPDATTIEQVAAFLGVEASQTLKCVCYASDGEVALIVIRGDLQVNEAKVQAALGTSDLRLADEAQIRALGSVPGYTSPLGLTGVRVLADPSAFAANLVAGSNRADTHVRNVNLGRDIVPTLVADVRVVVAGDACPVCGTPLEEQRGIEVGNIFKLGQYYARPLNIAFLDDSGEERLVEMGSYGFGVTRMMAAIAEAHHDEQGLRWPVSVAPVAVHLVALGNDPAVRDAAERVYVLLRLAGIATLFDDRGETAGVQFADADLLGAPLRLAVSKRTLAAHDGGAVELKRREHDKDQAQTVAIDALLDVVQGELADLALRVTVPESGDADGVV
jgi:prolyl-tRNA synthetase